MALGLLFGIRLFRSAQTEREQKASFGCYTSEQIIDHSLPLIDELGLRADTLLFNTAHRAIYSKGREQQRLWEVNCSDRSGSFCAILLWDADTGDLWSMGRYVKPAFRSGRPLARELRLRLARNWRHILSPRASDSQTSAPMVDEFDEIEQFTWKRNGVQEIYYLDKITGELLIFHRHESTRM
jgi:hypothetical protein